MTAAREWTLDGHAGLLRGPHGEGVGAVAVGPDRQVRPVLLQAAHRQHHKRVARGQRLQLGGGEAFPAEFHRRSPFGSVGPCRRRFGAGGGMVNGAWGRRRRARRPLVRRRPLPRLTVQRRASGRSAVPATVPRMALVVAT